MRQLIYGKMAIITLIIIMASSCKKSETVAPAATTTDEGYKSTSGNVDKTYEHENEEPLYPDFHLHLSAELTQEEADAKWNEALRKNLAEKLSPEAGNHNQAIFYISTYTGYGVNEGTDGSVRANMEFYTEVDAGNATLYYNNLVLDNPGNDREGGYDYYYFSKTTSQAIKWLGVKKLTIKLKGTDGWKLEQLSARSQSNYYTPGIATGQTFQHVHSNVWLDSPTSSGWDSYTLMGQAYSGGSTYNKLIFN